MGIVSENIATMNRRNTAFKKICEEVLDKKTRGDRILIEEVEPFIGKEDNFDAFRDRIRHWAESHGLGLIAIKKIGYRIATPKEQVEVVGRKHQRSKLTHSKKAVFHFGAAPDEGLSPADRIRRERLLDREAASLIRAERDEREARKLLGTMPEPMPRLKSSDDD